MVRWVVAVVDVMALRCDQNPVDAAIRSLGKAVKALKVQDAR